ncbi:response regulator transcription factor [Clostridium intestinale]|uniref:Stage 0 sporulation protein A homolog n=1 Tax=Clostridium intestinale URNW TaxID=1294142 RepID=U2PSH2_9CLOT|nr:response regulator transcription factor [Clostridium intestinale]ERK29405.1 two component LuxR family transcriptional regulator [Clostridium intestinale URNW]
MIRVAIVDDQRLMRDGLKTILELQDNIEVIGTASDGREVIDICRKCIPDVILMDIRMPGMNGVEATKIIKNSYPKIKILVLTTFDDEEYIIDALNYGASGYMLKDIDGDALIKAIEDAYDNKYILPSAIASKLVNKLISNSTSDKKEEDLKVLFTDRELEVAKMLSQGFTNKQISSSLFISEGTVKNNVSNIYSKIQIFDRTSAALYLKDILK